MATKVKPSRINITWVPSVWKVPVYVDDDTFQWWNGWWGWDMLYADFYFDTLTWASVDMVLSADYTPASNFTVNAPATMEDWQVYILRVNNSDPVYTMTLGTNITNPHNVDLTLTPDCIDMFVFLAVWWELELQPELNWIAVVDALNSTSTTSALSANQWKVLNDKISDLFWLWKFLSLWDATTWLPTSFPLQTPYTYSTWDYFLVETVSSATPPVNYRPSGSSYTGTASSTTESDELEVWDVYVYDGSVWLLQSNHWKTVTFWNIAWDPYDNTNLANALWDKQDTLVAWSNITIDPNTNEISANNTTYSSATSSTAWIVKLWSDTVQTEAAQTPSATTWKSYAVKLNSSWQMLVNVPRANTTYSSLPAASWWADVSLVTTWEKYTWNNKQDTMSAWSWISITSNSIANTWVLSVNSNTWAVTVTEFSPSNAWSTWQVLTKTAWWYDRAAAPATWIQNDTTWTTTTVTHIRAWTEAEYALITPDAHTIYHVY